jgi:hypothetical protein
VVNLSNIYEAIKTILSNDIDLMAYLGAHKIFIGRDLPRLFVPPAIQIVGMTDNISEAWNQSNCVFRINVYAMGNADGSAPLSLLAEIQDAIFDLLESQSLTVTGVRVFVLYIENRDADCIRDLDYDGEPGRYLMGTEWRILAA